MKVYVVIVYDARDNQPRIAGVFSDVSVANNHLDGHGDSEGFVEEVELDEIVAAPKKGIV